jgi:hypothetical protein
MPWGAVRVVSFSRKASRLQKVVVKPAPNSGECCKFFRRELSSVAESERCLKNALTTTRIRIEF